METGRNKAQPTERLGVVGQKLTQVIIANTVYTDVAGIPLNSDREKDPRVIKGIDFDYQKCPFSDSPSRFPNGAPHEVPLSGLERSRLAESYPEMMSILQKVRSSYLDTTRAVGDKDRPLNIKETQDILSALSYLPHYLVYRSENPLPAREYFPVALLVLANSSSGARAATGAYIEKYAKLKVDVSETVLDVDEAIDAAEKKGHMIGENTLCAASPKQMENFLHAVVHGPSGKIVESPVNDEFEENEVAKIVRFGDAHYQAISFILNVLREHDAAIYNSILRSPGVFDQAKVQYTLGAVKIVSDYNVYQKIAFEALGRPSPKYASFKDLTEVGNLRVPDLIKRVEAERKKPTRRENHLARRRLMR